MKVIDIIDKTDPKVTLGDIIQIGKERKYYIITKSHTHHYVLVGFDGDDFYTICKTWDEVIEYVRKAIKHFSSQEYGIAIIKKEETK
jgi:hypothetical protein